MPRSAAWLLAVAAGQFVTLAALLIRVRVLVRRPGAFECALLTDFGGWAFGIATFGQDRLHWHRVLSLHPRPSRSWPRSGLVLVERKPRLRYGRPTHVVELSLVSGGQALTLAVGSATAKAFVVWLEAAPATATPLRDLARK